MDLKQSFNHLKGKVITYTGPDPDIDLGTMYLAQYDYEKGMTFLGNWDSDGECSDPIELVCFEKGRNIEYDGCILHAIESIEQGHFNIEDSPDWKYEKDELVHNIKCVFK